MFDTKASGIVIPWDEKEIEKLEEFKTGKWTKRIQEDLIPTNGNRSKIVSFIHENYPTAVDRLKELEERLNEKFTGKKEIIKMIIVCAIAQQPLLLVGPPGTAKSLLITRFCEGLGITRTGDQTVFQYLLHSFTEPDEILGPVEIGKLQANPPQFARFRNGSITDAEVIFLDEVFKANSAILNALLTIINERRVYEGGASLKAKARLIYGASNRPPTRKQLEDAEAFYERFIIRMESLPIEKDYSTNKKLLQDLMQKSWENEVKELRGGYDPVKTKIEPVACLNDILLCNRAAAELYGGSNLKDPEIEDFLDDYLNLAATLDDLGKKKDYCSIDDRKIVRLFLVARAHAVFHKRRPCVDDLEVCKHTWKDEGSKVPLHKAVGDFMSEIKKKRKINPNVNPVPPVIPGGQP